MVLLFTEKDRSRTEAVCRLQHSCHLLSAAMGLSSQARGQLRRGTEGLVQHIVVAHFSLIFYVAQLAV